MKRASPVEMRKALESVEVMRRAGMLCVGMPFIGFFRAVGVRALSDPALMNCDSST